MARRKVKTKKDPIPVEWERMPEADELVQTLIKKYHPHLERAKILCLGKPKAAVKDHRVILAKVKRCSRAINALIKDTIGEQHYLIEIGLDAWKKRDKEARQTVLDHELCHCLGLDDKGNWALVGHDVEEFKPVIVRHGAWTPELEQFCGAAKQLGLPVEA